MRIKSPNRRSLETISIDFQGETYHVSFSRFPNGNIREVFVVAGKVGSSLQAIARDIGIALSVMFQNGMLPSDLERSMTQLDNGEPAGPIGMIVSKLNKEW